MVPTQKVEKIKELLTVSQIAYKLDITPQAVRLKIRKANCPLQKIGNLICVKREDAIVKLGYPPSDRKKRRKRKQAKPREPIPAG